MIWYTESYFGFEPGRIPQFSEELVRDVEHFLEKVLDEKELESLRELAE